ncbi:hypothetical protein WA1_50210 [Scytonema hofmannii PCC 7110]|uniref:Uncharacterized protein n=1 Tax=Scytonema hofmannii PCC 7110 TaxID=128403 RepID=A0A139WR41_9CYAN|nr:hypothetical protein WA1_50210 [Scytonema hofmannii PCC 7110]
MVVTVSFFASKILGEIYPKSVLRFLSFNILAVATLYRLKERKTVDGTTQIEKTYIDLFQVLYYIGFSLSIFTLSLDLPTPEPVVYICDHLKMIWDSIAWNQMYK